MSVAGDELSLGPIARPNPTPAEDAQLLDLAVPETIEFEETGKVSTEFYQQAQAATEGGSDMPRAEFIEAVAQKLIQHGGGRGDGDGPVKFAKSIKRHNWLAVIMAVLLGPGGAIAVIYATSDRSKANSHKVEELKKLEPRVEKTEEDIRYIKARVGEVGASMEEVKADQTEIVDGINELKQENVDQLKAELKEARWELRNRKRNPNRDQD